MFEIKCGDPSPSKGPASPAPYTRFVLPFAYNLEKITAEEKPCQSYVLENDPDKIWRERQRQDRVSLTPDTLFQ